MNNVSFEILTELFILMIALSLDAFAASFAYGASSIKIPIRSMVILSIVSSIVLALSATLGIFLKSFISQNYIKHICFILLMIPGIIKCFDSFIKSLIRLKKGINGQLNFKFLNLNFVLRVYADPDIADIDQSKILSTKEAIILSIALSLDSLVVGIGAALETYNFWLAIPSAFIFGMIAVATGSFIGSKTLKNIRYDISWISGVMLIILAIMKLF